MASMDQERATDIIYNLGLWSDIACRYKEEFSLTEGFNLGSQLVLAAVVKNLQTFLLICISNDHNTPDHCTDYLNTE